MSDKEGELRVLLSIRESEDGPILYFFPVKPVADEDASVIIAERDGDPYVALHDLGDFRPHLCLDAQGVEERLSSCRRRSAASSAATQTSE